MKKMYVIRNNITKKFVQYIDCIDGETSCAGTTDKIDGIGNPDKRYIKKLCKELNRSCFLPNVYEVWEIRKGV